LRAGAQLTQPLRHQAYVLASAGQMALDGVALHAGDGAEITEAANLTITAVTDAEILIIDVPAAA